MSNNTYTITFLDGSESKTIVVSGWDKIEEFFSFYNENDPANRSVYCVNCSAVKEIINISPPLPQPVK